MTENFEVLTPVKEDPGVYENHWKHDGEAHAASPKWAKYHSVMASEFPSPYRGTDDPLAKQIGKFVERLDMLRPDKDGPVFLGKSGELTYTYPEVKDVVIPQKMGDLEKVLDDVVELFEGAPNWGNPLTMCNVIPQSNTAAIVASMLSQVFSANILEGEYAQNVHKAELETAGMLGNLFGWDPVKAGCIYTWGGGGCWTYGLKYGLTRVLPNSRKAGVRTDAKVICSQQAHFVQKNASDWMGLGSDNIVHVRTDVDTNQMDVVHLEEILKDFQANKIPVATIVCTMGTTDASAIDPISKVREIMDRYPNPEGYGKSILYADAVVGWSWVYFATYDFENNPLGFSDRILPILKQNGQALKEIMCADAVGIDFHKVGWAPYVSSCFLYKNARDPSSLGRRRLSSGPHAVQPDVLHARSVPYRVRLAGWLGDPEIFRNGRHAGHSWRHFGNQILSLRLAEDPQRDGLRECRRLRPDYAVPCLSQRNGRGGAIFARIDRCRISRRSNQT
jgi:L-2,4-diaminobutyrate decarboxylase